VLLGFKAYVVADACRGVNLRPGDSVAAIDEMKTAGVRIVRSGSILKNPKARASRKTARKTPVRRRTTRVRAKERA